MLTWYYCTYFINAITLHYYFYSSTLRISLQCFLVQKLRTPSPKYCRRGVCCVFHRMSCFILITVMSYARQTEVSSLVLLIAWIIFIGERPLLMMWSVLHWSHSSLRLVDHLEHPWQVNVANLVAESVTVTEDSIMQKASSITRIEGFTEAEAESCEICRHVFIMAFQ